MRSIERYHSQINVHDITNSYVVPQLINNGMHSDATLYYFTLVGQPLDLDRVKNPDLEKDNCRLHPFLSTSS